VLIFREKPQKNPKNFHKPNTGPPQSSHASMGTFISSALEEICYHGPARVSLSSLCSTLALTPPSIKASLWTNLLSIPSLQFTVPGNDMPFSPDDDKIKRFEDAEKLYLKIVAKEHLRGSFVGLYDTKSTGISSNQRRALKRLAVASFFLLPSKFTKK
jgi:general transcription factor 3C polypeptide 1